MILRRVRDFLKKNKEATISQIAKTLKMEQDSVKTSLLHLMRKGLIKIKQENEQYNCSSCTTKGCNSCLAFTVKEAVIYQWNLTKG